MADLNSNSSGIGTRDPRNPAEFVRILDGEEVWYDRDTKFKVQTRRGHQPYETRYTTDANLGVAVHWYNGINIGNGYMKRLIQVDGYRTRVLLRKTSD